MKERSEKFKLAKTLAKKSKLTKKDINNFSKKIKSEANKEFLNEK